MPLSDFLTINTTTASAAPTQQSFGTPLILGACKNALTAFGAALTKTYSSLAGMASDSFATTDPEYLAAQSIWSQTPQLPSIVVGRRTNNPTLRHVLTILGTPVVGHVYTVFINGVAKSFTAATTVASDIATGLAAAIGTPSGFGAAVASTNTVTLTASAAGNFCRVLTVNPDVDMDHQQTHADAGVVADLTAVYNLDGGASWYTITLTTNSNAEVAALAAYVETIAKLYVADSCDSTILGSGTSDIASTLKTSAYVRSPVWYHADSGAFLGAAAIGKALPLQPGGGIWKFLQPSGVAAMVFTASQITNLTAKLANWLYTVAGFNITSQGATPSGQWIDTVRDRDWLNNTIAIDFFTALLSPPSAVNPANPGNAVPSLGKIPYTDSGIAIMESTLRGSLQKGVNQGVLAASPRPSVTVPLAASISSSVKTSRALTLPWSATMAGAIQALTINGGLSF